MYLKVSLHGCFFYVCLLLNESVVIAVLYFALMWGPVESWDLHRKRTLYLLDARDALSNTFLEGVKYRYDLFINVLASFIQTGRRQT